MCWGGGGGYGSLWWVKGAKWREGLPERGWPSIECWALTCPWNRVGDSPPPTDVRVCKACDAALLAATTVAAGILPGLTGAMLATFTAMRNNQWLPPELKTLVQYTLLEVMLKGNMFWLHGQGSDWHPLLETRKRKNGTWQHEWLIRT